jgi:sporulation protein YlmC with PRC-barrel domain
LGEEELMHVKLNELPGTKVFDANGREIGRVKAALVDMETWLVDTLRIGVSRGAAAEMEMPWSLWSFLRPPTVDVGTGQIHAAGDAIILRVALAELRDTPAARPSGALAAVH